MHRYTKGCYFNTLEDVKNKTITVMGLGLNGGGGNTVKFFLKHGATVIATDTKDEEALKSTIDDITKYIAENSIDKNRLIYHLGGHIIEDFTKTNCIIKNPIVDIEKNEYLQAALKKRVEIESDISVFLQFNKAPIIAVTGSKGKSTTVSAIQYGFEKLGVKSFLGGNITVSPLSFLDKLTEDTPVVLELSSWQLRDLVGRMLLSPAIAVITKIASDHQNWYSSMTDYVRDKSLIYANMGVESSIILDSDTWGELFATHCKKRRINIYRYDSNSASPFEVNVGNAATVLKIWGFNGELVDDVLKDYKGLPHRMQEFLTYKNATFINDSTATIPEAAIASLKTQCEKGSTLLIAGGTDKVLDFAQFAATIEDEHKNGRLKAIYLLAGSATEKMESAIKEKNIENLSYKVYNSINDILGAIKSDLDGGNFGGDAISVLFSPAATSFEKFTNEFDRGEKFMAATKEIFR